MRIAFDAQPLLDRRPTGVGRYQSELLKALLYNGMNDQYFLTYFMRRSRASVKLALAPFIEAGAIDNPCRFVYSRVYNVASRVLPIPYSPFFRKSDLTHFFNFNVPCGVHGKAVLTVYDMVFRDVPETMENKNRARLAAVLEQSIKRAHLIVTISQFSRERILHYYDIPEEQVIVAPCGVDHELFRPASEQQIDIMRQTLNLPTEYILYLGTIEPRKNLARLLDAYSALSASHALPPLVLAGNNGWNNGDVHERIAALGSKVIPLGFVDSDMLVPLISGAVCFAFPSLYEGFGLPPLEAMSCGVPTLVSDTASLPEVVGDCAVKVEPLSVDSIRDGLERLIFNDGLRSELSNSGKLRAADFTWAKAANAVHDGYCQLI